LIGFSRYGYIFFPPDTPERVVPEAFYIVTAVLTAVFVFLAVYLQLEPGLSKTIPKHTHRCGLPFGSYVSSECGSLLGKSLYLSIVATFCLLFVFKPYAVGFKVTRGNMFLVFAYYSACSSIFVTGVLNTVLIMMELQDQTNKEKYANRVFWIFQICLTLYFSAFFSLVCSVALIGYGCA
jgi:hypothetical protein